MKRAVHLFLVLLFVSCGSDNTTPLSSDAPNSDTLQQISSPRVSVQSVLSTMEKGNYKEGELLVKFSAGVVTASSLKAHQALGAVSLKRFAHVPNLEHVRLPQGLSVRDALMKYMEDPAVEYAEPNYIRRISTTPNDPLFNQQWGPTKISAPQAWDIATGSNSVIVAVLDTGIDLTHPELIANTGPGYNFIADTEDPRDDEGHGTHVSGIIGAIGNNGTGVAGMMWNVKLMPVKFLDANGEGTIADEISAIEFAITHGAKIMNASFAGRDFSLSEYNEIKRADTLGVLLMAAAGNETVNNDTVPSYPASFSNPADANLLRNGLNALPNIISVAATNQSDQLASFSNFGPNSVHVAAPGLSILSTLLPNAYGSISGTSQATPFVSGLAGLLYSYYTNFTYSQIRGTILKYVDVLGFNIMTGGRINAYKALSSLLTPTNLSASATSPGQISLTWTDNATGEDGYRIERKTGAGSFSQIGTTGPNATTTLSFTDSSLGEGTTYTYRVRAFNSLPNPPGTASIEGTSFYSNEVSANAVTTAQTITVTAPSPSSAAFNSTFGVAATASSGLPVVITTSGVCSGSGSGSGTITMTGGTGTCVVHYNQAGNSNYSAAPEVTSSTTASTAAQTITVTVPSPSSAAFNSTFGVAATASSGLPVAITTSGVCSGSGSGSATVTTTSSTGTCVVHYNQAGNSNYSAAPEVTNSSVITSSAPTPPPSGGSGGGGCSIGSRQNRPTAMADLSALLLPLLLVVIVRRRKKVKR